MMNMHNRGTAMRCLSAAVLLAVGGPALANTLNQNVSWTIDRSGTTAKYRIVAYGDSIYAGYNGSVSNAAKYAAPTVDAEYLAAQWGADIESIRRCARRDCSATVRRALPCRALSRALSVRSRALGMFCLVVLFLCLFIPIPHLFHGKIGIFLV